MSIVWPLLLIVTVVLLLLLALRMGERFSPGTVPFTRAFRCPFRDEDVRVEFAERAWDGRRVDVCRCSAFAPPSAVTCDKGCVDLPALPATRRTLTV
jgi:hypothetical protein